MLTTRQSEQEIILLIRNTDNEKDTLNKKFFSVVTQSRSTTKECCLCESSAKLCSTSTQPIKKYIVNVWQITSTESHCEGSQWDRCKEKFNFTEISDNSDVLKQISTNCR